MPRYDKLVRDRIPEIIAADGPTCDVEVFDVDAYLCALLDKLVEEAAETHVMLTICARRTRDEAAPEDVQRRRVALAAVGPYGSTFPSGASTGPLSSRRSKGTSVGLGTWRGTRVTQAKQREAKFGRHPRVRLRVPPRAQHAEHASEMCGRPDGRATV